MLPSFNDLTVLFSSKVQVGRQREASADIIEAGWGSFVSQISAIRLAGSPGRHVPRSDGCGFQTGLRALRCRRALGRRIGLATAMAAESFGVLVSRKVKTNIRQRHALADVGQARADLEARQTMGSTIRAP
jgi:hypothetical protein